MRQVDRSKVPPPEILSASYKKSDKYIAGSELERAVAHFTGPDKEKSFSFKRYKEDAVKFALEKLFHGKCAYCESLFSANAPVDVEHYRPKGSVSNSQHKGYWWLAADWDNLLPSCIDCNRRRKQELPEMSLEERKAIWDDTRIEGKMSKNTIQMGKKDLFPLKEESERAGFIEDERLMRRALSQEAPLLLNPTADNPRDFISYNVGASDDYSLVLPWNETGDRNERSSASVMVYGLNRLRLVQARTRVKRQLEFLYSLAIKLGTINSEVSERKQSVQDDLNGLPPSQAEKIEALGKDLAFFTSVNSSLDTMSADIWEKFEEMMVPEAPFSEFVRAWHLSKIKDLEAELGS